MKKVLSEARHAKSRHHGQTGSVSSLCFWGLEVIAVSLPVFIVDVLCSSGMRPRLAVQSTDLGPIGQDDALATCAMGELSSCQADSPPNA